MLRGGENTTPESPQDLKNEEQEQGEASGERIFIKIDGNLIDISPDHIPAELVGSSASSYANSKLRIKHKSDSPQFPENVKMFQETKVGGEGASSRYADLRWGNRSGDIINKRALAWLNYTIWDEGDENAPADYSIFNPIYIGVPVPVDKAPNTAGAVATTVIQYERTRPDGESSIHRYELESKCVSTDHFQITISYYYNGELLWTTDPASGHISLWTPYLGAGAVVGQWSYKILRNGSVYSDEGLACDIKYIVREIQFKNPFADIEFTPGDTLTFDNELIWSDTGTAPPLDDEPQWKVEIFDPQSEDPDTPIASSDWQAGSLMAWNWDSSMTSALTAQSRSSSTDGAEKKIFLVPKDRYPAYKYLAGIKLKKDRQSSREEEEEEISFLTYAATARSIGFTRAEIYPEPENHARYYIQTKKEVKTGPTLEIYDEDENLIASSNDTMLEPPYGFLSYPSVDDVSTTALMKLKAQIAFGNINKVNPKKHNQVIKCFVKLVYGPYGKDFVTINLKTNRTSQLDMQIKLKNMDANQKSDKYWGEYYLGPKRIDNESKKQLEIAHRENSFSWVDATSALDVGNVADSKAFKEGETARQLTEMGGAFQLPEPVKNYDDYVLPSKSALIAAGFEDVVGSFYDEKSGKTIEARTHIQNQAEEFYYSGHGSHATGDIWCYRTESKEEWLQQDDIPDGSWNEYIKYSFFACCSILDIGDYNNNYKELESHEKSPGYSWMKKFKKGKGTILLGYNWYAPYASEESNEDANIINSYFELRKIHTPIDAWLKANANSSDVYLSGDNACAIDIDNKIYYFINFQDKPDLLMHNNRQIVSVPSTKSNLTSKFEKIPGRTIIDSTLPNRKYKKPDSNH